MQVATRGADTAFHAPPDLPRQGDAPDAVGSRAEEAAPMTIQRLTLHLDGITAGDYLTWVHDPEPHTLARELRSVQLQADPLDQRIDVLLTWNGHPPPAQAAATAAGLTLTPETELRTSHH